MRLVSRAVIQLVLTAALAAAAGDQQAILARMDQAAASFQSMSAQVTKITHTAVINDDSKESGVIRLKRSGARDIRMLVEISAPEAKSYALRGRKAEIYYPKIQTVQEYDLGKHSQLMDQFLLLGFGTPSQSLRKNYSVKVLNEEVVAGVKASRLELVPKSEKAREYLAKAELWVSHADGRTVQQKFHEPSGDYRLVTYTSIQWNPPLGDSALALALPISVKREYPQR